MKILSYYNWKLWTRQLLDWLENQFAAVASSIDFTPVEEKLDEVKSDVADVKTAVEHIDIDTSDLAKEATLGAAPIGSERTTVFQYLAAILDNIEGQGGDDIAKESTSQDILALLATKTIPFTFGECEFVNTANVQDCASAMLNIANCTKLISDKLNTAPQVRSGWNNIQEVIFRAANSISDSNSSTYQQSSSCKIYEAENATTFSGYGTFANYKSLRKLNVKSLYINTFTSYYSLFQNVTNLIDIIIGKNLHLADANFLNNFFYDWSPANAMLENSQSLLTPEDIAAGFTSNLQKFLYNLREHFAANLADITGQASKSIRFTAEVKAAILADQTTADAFTNKGWTIA